MRTIAAVFLAAGLAFAAIPHKQQIAPGVWAAGFADKYGSANCGWVATPSGTLLIDLPKGMPAAEFLAEVNKLAGKPATRLMLTDPDSSDPMIAELEKAGVKRVTEAAEARFISYAAQVGRPGGAVFVTAQKVLFGGPALVNGPHISLAGADTAGWLDALARLEKIGAARVVPGFGSWGAPSMLARQHRFLLEVRRQVEHAISMGRSLEFIEKDVRLPAEYYVWMPYDDVQKQDIRHVYAELTAPHAPFNGHEPSASDPKPHALVLIADRYHEPGHIEPGLRPVFEATGVVPHFFVDTAALTAQNLAKVKLLVILRDGMLWPDGVEKPYRIWMTPEQEQAVVDFVQNGGGFLNLHNSMGLYPKDGPYLNLVGGRYIGHGPLERFRVEIVDPKHPVTRGVTPFFAADEQHTPPCDEKKVTVLLRNVNDDGKTHAAAGWAYAPGKGRLVHLAPGHTREALAVPQFQLLMRNAVNWLLKK
jgi:hypothetical protein